MQNAQYWYLKYLFVLFFQKHPSLNQDSYKYRLCLTLKRCYMYWLFCAYLYIIILNTILLKTKAENSGGARPKTVISFSFDNMIYSDFKWLVWSCFLGQNLVKSISLFLVLLLILTTILTHDEKKKTHTIIFHPVHLMFKMCYNVHSKRSIKHISHKVFFQRIICRYYSRLFKQHIFL